jgi:hypothetical protein
MTDGEKRLLDLKDACHHEGKMKAALEKAKTDAAAGEWQNELSVGLMPRCCWCLIFPV